MKELEISVLGNEKRVQCMQQFPEAHQGIGADFQIAEKVASSSYLFFGWFVCQDESDYIAFQSDQEIQQCWLAGPMRSDCGLFAFWYVVRGNRFVPFEPSRLRGYWSPFFPWCLGGKKWRSAENA